MYQQVKGVTDEHKEDAKSGCTGRAAKRCFGAIDGMHATSELRGRHRLREPGS
jgi:hypothetical protein